ncbi:hypothetical protein NDU88_003217 [Pleurodeles waltl]|uniref:Uncharacterized protein n=1 Tax=Pleurodeles waltl TaxID=8319 RepID=A0AAV7VEU5_PLEWA|nr:hypothetical protein NDU88_003217 [Pleurodeles waltl]
MSAAEKEKEKKGASSGRQAACCQTPEQVKQTHCAAKIDAQPAKNDARSTGMTQPNFARRRSMQRKRSGQKFDARPTGSVQIQAGMTQPDFL